jgi:hypothetical protein
MRERFHIRVNHDADELVKTHFWFPIENLSGFGGVPHQQIYFRRHLITEVVSDEFLPIKIDI